MINGTCPVDRPFPNDDQVHYVSIINQYYDNLEFKSRIVFTMQSLSKVMRKLGYVKMHSYDRHTHGQFFWNFRTELEPRWDYQEVSLGMGNCTKYPT